MSAEAREIKKKKYIYIYRRDQGGQVKKVRKDRPKKSGEGKVKKIMKGQERSGLVRQGHRRSWEAREGQERSGMVTLG